MKELALALLLLPPTALFAASTKPNPADFPITIHVVYSRSVSSSGGTQQQIDAVVDGKQVELTANSLGVLALGDYPARISPSFRAPSFHPNSYDIYQGYDFLMPDAKIRTFALTAIGSTDTPAPTSSAPTNP
jgi:hypothetical protein